MKSILTVFLLSLLTSANTFCQEDPRIMRLNKYELKESLRGSFQEMDNAHIPAILDDRYQLMGYKPLKYDGYRIISAHQPNTNFDMVYFIDKSGHTTKKIMATTAPHNFDNGSRAYYDSLNPYGSNDMQSALLNVLLQTVINHGLSLK